MAVRSALGDGLLGLFQLAVVDKADADREGVDGDGGHFWHHRHLCDYV